MTFHRKLCLVQKHCELDLMKQMDLLKFMIGLVIQFYLSLKIWCCLEKNEYPIIQKSGITYVFAHNYAKIKIDS